MMRELNSPVPMRRTCPNPLQELLVVAARDVFIGPCFRVRAREPSRLEGEWRRWSKKIICWTRNGCPTFDRSFLIILAARRTIARRGRAPPEPPLLRRTAYSILIWIRALRASLLGSP